MRILTLATLLAGCGTQEGTEKGDDTGVDSCVSEVRAELAVDEVSPAGFSGQDLLDWLTLGSEAPLTWSDGATTRIAFTFALGSQGIWYQHFEQNPSSDVLCESPDRVTLGVLWTAATEDGHLDESQDLSVWTETATEAHLVTNTSGRGGALDHCGGEQELIATFTPSGTSGRLECDGQASEETASW